MDSAKNRQIIRPVTCFLRGGEEIFQIPVEKKNKTYQSSVRYIVTKIRSSVDSIKLKALPQQSNHLY